MVQQMAMDARGYKLMVGIVLPFQTKEITSSDRTRVRRLSLFENRFLT